MYKRSLSISAFIFCLLALAPLSHGQTIADLIQQLQSTDPATRIQAFYGLHPFGYSSTDDIKVAVIDLLARETAYSGSQVSLDENYTVYFEDLIYAVAELNDPRVLNALLNVLDTGNIAINALARLGTVSLDAVVSKSTDLNVEIRTAAVLALNAMLDPSNLQLVKYDPIAMLKIRSALEKAALDPNPYTSKGAAMGLAMLPPQGGDLNGDGKVDCADLAIIKASFGKKKGQSGFDARADVNNDGIVDVRDLAIVSRQLPLGTKCP